MTSEIIHLVHWVIYIISIISLICLFTKYKKWGALWISVLFASQVLFNGCIIIKWQNYYRLKESLLPISDSLLVDRFSQNPTIQIILTIIIAVLSFLIYLSEKNEKVN